MFGFSIFIFEGTGISKLFELVLTIRNQCQNKENFKDVLKKSYLLITTIIIVFSLFTYFVYGSELNGPIILSNLPIKNVIVQIMIFVFNINLIISFPI